MKKSEFDEKFRLNRFKALKWLFRKLPITNRDIEHLLRLEPDKIYDIMNVINSWTYPSVAYHVFKLPVRPQLKYCQQPTDYATSVKRARLIESLCPKNVLFVGDDDLVSLELDPEIDITVIDIDYRILRHINEQNPDISTFEIDVIAIWKKWFGGTFDVVFTDPPNNLEDAQKFIDFCMNMNPAYFLYNAMSYLFEEMPIVPMDLYDEYENFNFYPFSPTRKFCNRLIAEFLYPGGKNLVNIPGSYSNLYIFKK